jgi:hypothetical protein
MMDDEEGITALTFAEATRISGAKNGELDWYRSGRDLRNRLEEAAALVELRNPRNR